MSRRLLAWYAALIWLRACEPIAEAPEPWKGTDFLPFDPADWDWAFEADV